MTQAQQVHLDLVQRMRELGRVREIQAKPLPPSEPYKPTPEETLALNAKIKALKAKGLRNFEIADQLRVSRSTVGRHVKGKCSTAAKAAKRRL